MTRIDLDDLPPRIAALLTAAADGQAVVLVQGGLVVGRLIADAAPAPPDPRPEGAGEVQAAEIFEQFRAAIEDEF